MRCAACHHDNREGAVFCERCGGRLSLQCGRCGTALRPGARFCDACGLPQADTPGALEPEGERRQVTLMFCDLADSTALSERIDPEELRDVLASFHDLCGREISEFGGHVGRLLGDGILAYFGYPLARDNDARAAVGAGLSIVRRIREAHDGAIAVRVGIHTGLVVIGALGSGEHREWTVMGTTPNVAARLQGIAARNAVVVSPATLRLVQGFFDVRSLGPQALKGLSAPLEVFEVRGERAVQSRVEAALGTGLTPLVGREAAVGAVLAAWRRATAGAGQVALVRGDAGIGKSRLLQELKDHVAADAAIRLECRCTPYHQNSALFPVIDLLQRIWELRRADSPGERLERLEHGAAPFAGEIPDLVPLLADLLSVPLPSGRHPELHLTPQARKQRTLDAVAAMIVAMARAHPVVFAVEDAHWIDPSSLELVGQLLPQLPHARLLLVLLYRPTFTPPHTGGSEVTLVELERLDAGQATDMMTLVAGGRPLPPEVVQELLVKADGVPLFVEELTKMVLESGMLRERHGRLELDGKLATLAIPLTLRESLIARLDRLAPVKEVVHVGATLGRAFSYDMIRAVALVDDQTLQTELARLVDADVLQEHGSPPATTYVFKHILIQEAAYEALLKHRRRDYHERVARTFEASFPDLVATQPEVLAHHWARAGRPLEAIDYVVRAGRRAIERSAYVEAEGHLQTGRDLLGAIPDSTERLQRELQLSITFGPALVATHGFAAPDVEQVYGRARALCEQVGDPRQHFAALGGLHLFHQSRAELKTGLALAAARLEIAERLGDPALVAQVYECEGTLRFWLGDHAAALRALEASLARYDPEAARRLAVEYGTEGGVVCGAYAAQVLWFLGRPDQALRRALETVALARSIGHANSLGLALDFAAALHALRGEIPETLAFADEAIAFSAEQQLPFWHGFGTIFRGWCLTRLDRSDDGLLVMMQGMASFQGTGALVGTRLPLAMLCDAYLRAGQIEAGRTLLEGMLPMLGQFEDRFYDPELLRIHGELLLAGAPADPAAAEASLRNALDLARAQGARGLELRAATSLARCWAATGRAAESVALLAPCRRSFDEGEGTGDVREADALLAALDAAPLPRAGSAR